MRGTACPLALDEIWSTIKREVQVYTETRLSSESVGGLERKRRAVGESGRGSRSA